MATISGNISESEAVSTWRVTATKCKDGALAGTTTTTGSSYSITTADTEPCNVTLAPKIDYAWSAAKGVVLNDYVVAANPDTAPHLWQATAVTGDPYYNQVSLLLHCDGTNGSTTFTDNSPTPKTITVIGNAQISTAQSKFGGASALFDGTGDELTAPTSPDFAFGTADFTIEFWYRSALATGQNVFDIRPSGSNGAYPALFVGTSGEVSYYVNSAYRILSGAGAVTANTWTHIAVTRAGTSTKLFIQGAQAGSTWTDATTYAQSVVRIGVSANGNLDDIRITKGVARYTTTFTPHTVAHPDAAAVTGATEPSWNLSGTTTDNTVTWTYVAPLVDPKTLGPKIPS